MLLKLLYKCIKGIFFRVLGPEAPVFSIKAKDGLTIYSI